MGRTWRAGRLGPPRTGRPARTRDGNGKGAVYDFAPPQKLGVGFTYQPGLQVAIEACRDLIDYFELSPDLLCHERLHGDRRTLAYHPAALENALAQTAGRPVVVHGLGLSIGSVSGWNEGYLQILDLFHR